MSNGLRVRISVLGLLYRTIPSASMMFDIKRYCGASAPRSAGWLNDTTRLETRIEESKTIASGPKRIRIVKATFKSGRYFVLREVNVLGPERW